MKRIQAAKRSGIELIYSTMRECVTSSAAATGLKEIEAFGAMMRGELLRPGESSYESARQIHNGMIDHRPILIACCDGISDVKCAVDFARDNALPISVKSGGHGVTGSAVSDGGLMIDLSRMKAIHVDPNTRIVRAEAGCTWGEFDVATQALGLATTGGIERTTGIAGLTLAGGYGFLMRKYGLTCDNLVSANLVTAAGNIVRASANENQDLFWAIRGGGGNFGIVVEFEYQLHPVQSVYGGLVAYPLNRAREIIRHYDDFVALAPDEFGSLLVLGTLPDGTKAVILLICYCGPEEDGKGCVEPLLGSESPLMSNLAQMPYEDVQSIVEKFNPRGLRNYWKSCFLKEVSSSAADVMIERFSKAPIPYTHVVLYSLGGAMTRVNPDDTAIDNRDARHSFLIVGMWEHSMDDERNIEWVRTLSTRMEPFSSGGFYSNFDSEIAPDRVQIAFGKEKYRRLQAVKDKYDPTNFFRPNHNIKPSQLAIV